MDDVVGGYGPAVKIFHDVLDPEGETSSLLVIAHSHDDGHGFFVGYGILCHCLSSLVIDYQYLS